MKQRLGFAAAAFCSALALAGCGSVTADLNFKAPDGWTSSPPIMGHMQMWMKPNTPKGRDQVVILVRGSSNSEDFFKNPQFGTSNVRNVERTQIKICGNQPAERLSAVGTGKAGDDEAIEGISSVVGNSRYAAMYVRPAASTADPAAESALHSLCPKA